MGHPISRKQSLTRMLIYVVLLAALLGTLLALDAAGIVTRFYENLIILICVNIILATSLNIATGFLGQIALGHAGFMAIGAYTAGLFVKATPQLGDLPRFLIALPMAGTLAAIFGVLVGVPALRLKGDYLAIITLGFGEIIRVLIENFTFTGGPQGLTGIPHITTLPAAYLTAVICVILLFAFVRSRFGRAITAIRDDDIAAEASGINITNYKVLAFTVAAFFAGIAGAVYAMQSRIISASNFGFMRSIDILVIVVLGGMGSLTGSIVGAVALTILPELLRDFADYRMLAYSVALIAVMIFKPSGLFGRYEFSLGNAALWLRRKIMGQGKKEAQTP